MSEFDPKIQTEDIAFATGDLVACPKCSRSNPPNRAKCIYCGEGLGVVSATAAKPVIRPMEEWELGFNLVVASGEIMDVNAAASYLGVDREIVASIAESGHPLPIARLETRDQAVAVQQRLTELGFRGEVISDADLLLDRPPVRLASIGLTNDGIRFTLFGRSESVEVRRGDICLIVSGLITQSSLESSEKRSGRKSKGSSETAMVSDEPLVDIYTVDDQREYRIHFSGFDFSFLGNDKSLVAAENLKRAVKKLTEISPGVKTDSDYRRLRPILETVWPTDTRRESQGMRRSGFGGKEVASTSTTSNLVQFTKYSRLRRHFV